MNEQTPKDINVKELWKTYAPREGNDIMEEEDIKTIALKKIIAELPSFDRTIFLLYCEMGSLRQVAQYLDVSHSAVIKKVDNIKMQILSEFYSLQSKALMNKITRQIRHENNTDNTYSNIMDRYNNNGNKGYKR